MSSEANDPFPAHLVCGESDSGSARRTLDRPGPMTQESTPRVVVRGVLESVSRGGYGADCDIRPSKHTRFLCYRATFVSYRTTPLMGTPDQSSPVVPVDGITSGGRQIGAAARTTGSIQILDSLLPMGESRSYVPTKRIQNCCLRRSGLPVEPTKERR